MNLYDFLDEIFREFPPTVSDFKPFEVFYAEYRTELEKLQNNYDFESALNDIKSNYAYAKTPYISVLKRFLNNHRIEVRRKNGGLEEIYEIRKTPKLTFDNIDSNVKDKMLSFCNKYGIKTKLKEALK